MVTPYNDTRLSWVAGKTVDTNKSSSSDSSRSSPWSQTISVSDNVTTLSASDIIPVQSGTSVIFYGNDSTYTTPTSSIMEIEPGDNNVYVKTVSQDGDNTDYYKFIIQRAKSRDITLATVLGQPFKVDSNQHHDYEATIKVPYDVATVGPDDIVPNDKYATVEFYGTSDFDNITTEDVNLTAGGSTDIYFVIVAQDDRCWLRYKITIKRAAEFNRAPVLKSGVNTENEVNVLVNTPFTLDLSTIFEDPDDDQLTYFVGKSDSGEKEADAIYTITPTEVGNTILHFVAYDGKDYSTNYYNLLLKADTVLPQTYTVTFDKYGGNTEATPKTKTAVSGGNIGTLPTPPTRSGYIFAGWNTAANGSGSIFTAATPVTSDITVYAQWRTTPPSDAEKVAADKEALEIGFARGDSASSVTQNLTLAATGSVYNSTITWVSSNTAVISNSGEVIRPSFSGSDATVSVTASVYSNEVFVTKDFILTVLKQPLSALKSIEIARPANKLVYTVGESLDITGLLVIGTYNDNSIRVETITADNVTGFDSSKPAASQVLTVTVGGKSTTYTVTIMQVPGAPTITTASLPDGTVNTAYSQTLAATGDTPITWSKESGDLPEGLSLSDGGVISGTPTTAGTYTFTVKAANAAGSDTRELSITINAVPAATLQSIAITKQADKLVYTVGEPLDTTGMEVTGHYSDGSSKNETITTANVTGFDSSAPAASQVLT
ncbi:immunoglobulin-like domain-containing protein, partial [Syntrophomonas palmitatica]|uniref:immunoglobulin-like domain-containing protein n=1 Tax=Syntrophomonas palmitatica TaxID=402877 RepID=UPI00155DB859